MVDRQKVGFNNLHQKYFPLQRTKKHNSGIDSRECAMEDEAITEKEEIIENQGDKKWMSFGGNKKFKNGDTKGYKGG
ncbi:hypothetical protein [Pseudomonas chlororaphis]|uniref:hypothetical protein n=1 Tax=Pseudomonas chlororaphis TaxID=587753 RepID=UPI002407AE93|nr:hypothetical protein [Pseudomonas chlororaphis]